EVFDLEQDRLVFDVGHQRFPYFLLMEKRRHGVLRFPQELEEYSMYTYPGFAGLGAACAQGFSITFPQNKMIAMVGDGSLTCGEVFESLNNIGALQNNVLIIINQNGQSITDNVGALADGKTVKDLARALKLEYIGLMDGHNTEELIEQLLLIKNKKNPVVLHVQTVKGKGYPLAENAPMKFHRPTVPYEKENGTFSPQNQMALKIMGESMGILEKKGLEYIQKYQNVYFTVPACPVFSEIPKQYPDRVIDTGISEQHCMTVSTMLAELGNKVIMALIGPFMYRCYSQIIDLAHQGSPLTIVFMMSGVNTLGATHQAVGALGVLKLIPNLTIMHPINLSEYTAMLDYAVKLNKPVFLDVPKESPLNEDIHPIEYGKGAIIKSGSKITVLPIGSLFSMAMDLEKLCEDIEILNPRFLKPFDFALLEESIKKTKHLLILEDGLKTGGLGEEIIYHLVNKKIPFTFRHVGAIEIYPTQEDYVSASIEYGITKETCESALRELLAEM
ncbi:MAG TPA: 1-deoxy-D-xylulose-5-phosphate synthase N-terminal domain-containing protein, partial [Gammaproteobacteria bacterium]|nr:1-deoxy-D-xylulose-5-phosphate synthase N-terminal domain-containing protein [Gammaproteobacteria bacterium]